MIGGANRAGINVPPPAVVTPPPNVATPGPGSSAQGALSSAQFNALRQQYGDLSFVRTYKEGESRWYTVYARTNGDLLVVDNQSGTVVRYAYNPNSPVLRPGPGASYGQQQASDQAAFEDRIEYQRALGKLTDSQIAVMRRNRTFAQWSYATLEWGDAAFGVAASFATVGSQRGAYDDMTRSIGIRNRLPSGFISPPIKIRIPLRLPIRGIWDLGPGIRGEYIEKQLGQNLPQNYKVLDVFKNGIGTSIKSINLRDKSYANPAAIIRLGRRYIDELAKFTPKPWAGVDIKPSELKSRELVIAIPPSPTADQLEAIEQIKAYGNEKGVTVVIVEVE